VAWFVITGIRFLPAAFLDLPFLFTPALRFEGCGGISKSVPKKQRGKQ
jgi:hypothetical protein